MAVSKKSKQAVTLLPPTGQIRIHLVGLYTRSLDVASYRNRQGLSRLRIQKEKMIEHGAGGLYLHSSSFYFNQ